MKSKELTWQSAAPGAKPKIISEIDDQHLCNIIWFKEVFHKSTRYNDEVMFLMCIEWHKRCNKKAGKELFDGEVKRLPWKPLPVLTEIQELNRMGMIHVSGSIIREIYENKFETIGSITHIDGWEDI